MKKHGIGSRLLSMLLAVVMVLSMVPRMQLDVFAAIGDLERASDYTFSDFDYSDTINLPIQIYDYSNDGMLFDYLLGGATGSYTHEGTNWIDYIAYKNGGGIVNNYLYSANSGGNGAYLASAIRTHDSVQYVRYTSNLARRAFYKISDKEFTKDVDDIRYFVIGYRAPSGSSTSSAMFGISTRAYTYTDNLLKASEEAGEFTGYYNSSTRDNNWRYAIIDLRGEDANGVKHGITADTVEKLYLLMPMTSKSQYVDILGFGFYDNYGDAEQYGQYMVTAGSEYDTGLYNNAGFSLLVDSDTTSAGKIDSADAYIANHISEYGDTSYSTGTSQYVAFAASETSTQIINGSVIENVDGDSRDIGYDLFMEFEKLATMGLLESSLSDNGVPVYKESVIEYLATLLRNRLCREGKFDGNGWQNYAYVTGSSEWFSVDKDGDGQYDATERMDLAAAIRSVMGVAESTTANVGSLSYTNTMKKAAAGQLTGSWDACKGNMTYWTDVAYYLLHNLFVPNSYNQAQDTYYYFVMPSAKDSANGGERTYVFDAGFTNVVGATTANATASNTQSALSYNDNGTISLSGIDSKFMIYYTEEYTTTFHPFLPIHTVAGDRTSQNETDSPYYTDSGVNSTGTYGETYLNRNYNYTMASQGQFVYFEDQDYYFNFEGDDDVYLFINGELVLDLGATHSISRASIKINDYVEWAQDILTNGGTAAEKARAEKLNLQDGESYRFDFFYMERHGTGANLKISTNIPVTDPAMGTDKKAYQNGVEIPNAGVASDDQLIEYAFSITNDTSTKLYDLEFYDETIGTKLGWDGTTFAAGDALNAEGDPLTVQDLVAYVDGYTADGQKIETIEVTFSNETELKNFLDNLTADGTESSNGTTAGHSGDGLWEDATLTIRGIYLNLLTHQSNGRFTNTLNVKAHSSVGIEFLGEDSHRVYTGGEPSFYQWAGYRLNISKDDIYEGVMNSSNFTEAEKNLLPTDAGNAKVQLCREDGTAVTYTDVTASGGNNYINVRYKTTGAHMFFVKIYDEMDSSKYLVVPITVYSVDPEDDVLVLDYGLSSVLTDSSVLIDDAGLQTSGPETKVSIMAYQAATSAPSYLAISDFSRLTPKAGNYSGGFNDAYYQLNKEVVLEWEKPWTIEFEGCFEAGMMLLSDTQAATTSGNTYIHINTSGFFLGYRDSVYNNSGISWDIIGSKISGFDYTDYNRYRLVNRPTADGTSNMVYLYVDGTEVGPMNQVLKDGNNVVTSGNNIAKRDFTFNYLGTSTASLGLRSCNINYLKVWEDGDLATTNRWITSGGKLVSDSSDDNERNDTVLAGTEDTSATTNISKDSYSYEKTVALYHDKEWTIRWKGNLTANTLLFASTQYSASQNMPFIYVTTDAEVLFGYYDYTANDGTNPSYANEYINYGITAPTGVTKTGNHAFRLTNKINSDGTNSVYLYMDGVEVGPLTTAFDAGTSLGRTDKWISGKDFFFSYFGTSDCAAANSPDGKAKSGHQVSGSISYIEVDTGIVETGPDLYLENYKNSAGQLLDMLCTDINNNRVGVSNVGDSAQTTFDDTANGNGTFTVNNGKLTYTPNSMDGWVNSLYLVMTVHKSNFTPSPVGPAGATTTDDNGYRIDIGNEVQVYKKVTVIPANVVYYEDDFPAVKRVDTTNNKFTQLGATTGSTKLEQDSNQDSNYGSDPGYQGSYDNMSGDSLYEIEIKEHRVLAYFEFTGTGFEIVARTNATTAGSIYLTVYNSSDVSSITSAGAVTLNSGASAKAIVPVITEFDNDGDSGAEMIYQVPVISWNNGSETAGQYIVTISGAPMYDFSTSSNGVYVPTYLWLDGIRVYHPMAGATDNKGTSSTTDDVPYEDYYNKTEQNAEFYEVREMIVGGYIAAAEYNDSGVKISNGTTSWTENRNNLDSTNSTYVGSVVDSVNDYLIMGPNNEVYMDGTFTYSSIIFYVSETSGAAAHSLQLAIRAIDWGWFVGAGPTYEGAQIQYGVKVGDTWGWKALANITSATEQYYTIPYTECPVNSNGYYQVAIRVAQIDEKTPALASFGKMKVSGLDVQYVGGNGEAATLAYVNGVLTNTITGAAVAAELYADYEAATYQMSSDIVFTPYNTIIESEGENGSDFDDPAEDDTEPVTNAVITPKYPTLSFEDEVYYNVYFDIENMDGVAMEDMGLITFTSNNVNGTIADADDVIPGVVYSEAAGLYIARTNGIPAKNLGDTVYFKVYARLADGSYVYSNVYNYSALAYAQDRLVNSNNPELKALVVAMLNYGASAQKLMGYNTDNLVNAGLTAEQRALVSAYDSGMIADVISVDSSKVGAFTYKSEGYTVRYPSVSFEGAFAINYYFTPALAMDDDLTFYYWDLETYNSVTELTAENATGTTVMTDMGNGRYLAVRGDIAAKDIDETVFVAAVYESNGVSYCTGVLAYSLGAYCVDRIANGGESMQELAAATAVYGYYAKEYFN